MKTEQIHSEKAAPALGPYCHGRKFGDMIITSGQIPMTKEGECIYEIQAATKLVLENLLSVVEAGGGTKESIAKVDIFVNNLEDFDSINKVYTEFFGEHKPARVLVQVEALAKDVPLEAAMMAFVENSLV